MPNNKKSVSSKSRDYDRESGKDRTKSGKSRRPAPPVSEHESELSASESEVESELELEAKETARRRTKPARKPKARPQQDQGNDDAGEEPEPSASAERSVAPAVLMLTALSYRLGLSVISQPARSFYIPDVNALFSAAYFICDTLALNGLLHETFPAFTSVTFYLYVGHLFFYHILRIRESAGELTREERRCLRYYGNLGQPESWPVPTPLIGILSSFGMITPPSKYHAKIVPKLPDISALGTGTMTCLQHLNNVHGIARIPIIPAIQKFLRNIGSTTADFTNDVLYPLANPALTPGAAGPPIVAPNVFCNISDSTAATGAAFQTLAFSSGWNPPTESNYTHMNVDLDLKRTIINRLRIPDVPNGTAFHGLELFLGFADGRSNAWMKHLLSCASAVCAFFPNSGTLEQIDTNTVEEMPTAITWTAAVARVSRNNAWYRGRQNWRLALTGKVNSEQSGSLYKVAASAAPRSQYTGSIIPDGLHTIVASDQAEGPYFVNPAGEHTVPLTLVESQAQRDPVETMRTYIEQHMYDKLGGRARS
jgi:hypothetical protein